MLSPKLLFSFCSSSVLPLFLCVFSVIILATCDFSCVSRLFHVSLQILFIAAPPPPPPNNGQCPDLFLAAIILAFLIFRSGFFSAGSWQLEHSGNSPPVCSYMPSNRWTSPKSWGWETGSEAWAWKVLLSTFSWILQCLLQKSFLQVPLLHDNTV